MPFYRSLGQIPPKRHTQFRQPDGSLYKEELVSSLGFSGIYSLLYHAHMPTKITKVGSRKPWTIEAEDVGLLPVHLRTAAMQGTTGHDIIESRMPMLFNKDVVMYLSKPEARSMNYFYKNGEADEVIFLHEGSGWLISQFGKLAIRAGDYVVVPRTVIYKLEFEAGPVKMMVTECFGPVETVRRYRNEAGQLEEHSPYCERDIRTPEALVLELENKATVIKVKKQGWLQEYHYEHSPLDVVGWDGYLFPYALSIHDFEPITGRLHMPPPIHQTFQAPNLVICSFVPRLFDYHPLAIPAPYNHSNIDSDEVLYYVEGNFMSRKGIDVGSFTLHPGGLPHGPHPGTAEASIGAKETHELAVMVDTFRPLLVAKAAMPWLDQHYPLSWND